MGGKFGLTESLAPLIQGAGHEEYRDQVHAAFRDELFERPLGLSDEDRCALTYRRLRHLNDRLDVREPLLGNRPLLFTLFEFSALADPSLFYATFLHHGTTMGAVRDFGEGREDLTDIVQSLTSMESVGSLMMTELGRGNSNAAIRTEAVYDAAAQEFVLHTPDAAAVKFPPGVASPGVPRLAVVSARLVVDGTDQGLFFFVVPIQDADGPCPGVRVVPQRPTALLPLDCSLVAFDGVRIPFRNWLRDGATLDADGSFTDPAGDRLVRTRRLLGIIRHAWEAATVGLAAVSRASAAVAVRHAHRRSTFGRLAADQPVIAYRNQQRALFGALATAYVTAFAARSVATEEQPRLTAATVRGFSLLKVAVDRYAERVTSRSRTASGALGFFADNRFLDYQGLAHSFNAAAADNEIMLTDSAQTLAAGIDYTPPSATPLADADSDAGQDLLDPATWTRLAHARESRLHQELTDGLRKAAEAGLTPFEAWNEHGDLGRELAWAHAQSQLTALVREALDAVAEPAARAVLTDLLALHVLEETGVHDGWYLAEGLLTVTQVRGLRQLANDICARLAPHALELAEALGVPYDVVGAPIATDDYVQAIAGDMEPFAPHPATH
ncbi:MULTISPECIES: acyl-CoA dehydrogenase [unclassified Streptomyces]|uniref:acyl-CoA dehydrogenase n=1 Tax=unclassified Streptomyces TaxID=2593676 RepID=UPI002E81D2BC|nr:acyl-CoA dehydrogenase [Streptomyces sp. NBC_00589]WTI38550.1 hypothetical protein OIC96_27955 [Streptomyces sp. NBC_00775]WUB27771.1 hypothetical protein OHA51_21780 [Streptomyces sp. NBC_00589]